MASNGLAKSGGKHNSIALRPVGRPETYKPEMCARVEALGKQGKSPAQIASALAVSKQTVYRWAGERPEFNDSLSRAKTYEQAYWEERGHKSLNRKHFQAQVWRTSMAARFKDDYTESKAGVEVTLNLGEMVAASISPPKQIEPSDVTLEPPKPKL